MGEYSARIGSEVGPSLRLAGVLATSACGASFAADSAAHGKVVVDLLDAEYSAELGGAFIAGARRAAGLDHPAAVPVLADGVSAQGEAYVIRPYWEGESASELIARRPARIPPVEALRLVGDLLEIVTAAHAQGLVHGAIATSEVFIVDDGSVRLLGLGWRELRQRLAEQLGVLPMPAGFVSPERLTDPRRIADAATDIWSVGAVLFALLTGEVPYEGKSEAEQRASALERAPRTLTELFGESSLALARLVDAALDPDPARRFGPARMRALVRDTAQLPELFLLRDLRSQQSRSPISGPRRSPSAQIARPLPPPVTPVSVSPSVPSSVPPSGVRPPSHPGIVAIEFRSAETVPAMTPVRGVVADTVPAMPRVESPAPSARRRRLADVLVGEATATEADVRVLTELFQRLERAVVAHAEGELESAEALHALALGVQAALAASRGGFVWNVAPWGFSAGNHAVWEPIAPLSEVPYRLYRDGVRSCGMFPGIDAVELARFVDALAAPDSALSAEDDRVTLLGGAHFEHLAFRVVAVPAAEPAEPRQAAARQRQHIVALAAFDTTTQLEECWQDGHEGRAPVDLEPIAEAPEPVGAVARRALEARFLTESTEITDHIVRVAEAALAVGSQAGATLDVARHLVAQLERLAPTFPERALGLCRSLSAALGGTKQVASWIGPTATAHLLRQSACLSSGAVATLIELVAELDSTHAPALRETLTEVKAAELRAAIEQHLATRGGSS